MEDPKQLRQEHARFPDPFVWSYKQTSLIQARWCTHTVTRPPWRSRQARARDLDRLADSDLGPKPETLNFINRCEISHAGGWDFWSHESNSWVGASICIAGQPITRIVCISAPGMNVTGHEDSPEMVDVVADAEADPQEGSAGGVASSHRPWIHCLCLHKEST